MAKCGCAGSTCGCKIAGSGGVEVTGTGTAQDPYVLTLGDITIDTLLTVDDTTSVNLTLLGSGETGDPYVLSAAVTPGVDVTSIPTTGGTTNIDDNESLHLFNHPSTIATHTISLSNSPSSLLKEVTIIATSIITTLTVAGEVGTTVAGAPTTLAANGYFKMRLVGTVWRRVG